MDRHDLLNLPTMQVVAVEATERQYVIKAEVDTRPFACPKCGGNSFYGHGTKTQVFADLPSHGQLVTVQIDRKRFRCRACGVTVLQPLPDIALADIADTDSRSGGRGPHDDPPPGRSRQTGWLVPHIRRRIP